jgi:segregation and condensation protein A
VLRVKKRMTFEEFFDGMTTRFDLVITFLALLEMTKLRMTRLWQADFNSQIYVEFSAQVTSDDETTQENPPLSDDDAQADSGDSGDAPPEHDSDKTIIDAAPPEIDDLLAPDDESARELHANDASPNSSVTAEFVMPAGGVPGMSEGMPESEQVTREMLSPPEAVAAAAAAFTDEEAGTNKTSTVADAAGSEADMLLASLGDENADPASEPPVTSEEPEDPAPPSQDVPPLEDES